MLFLHPLIRQQLAANVDSRQVSVANTIIRKALGSDVVSVDPQPVIRALINLGNGDPPFQHPAQPSVLWNGDAQVFRQRQTVGDYLVHIQRLTIGSSRARHGGRSGLMCLFHARTSNEKEQPGFCPHCS